MRSRLPLLVLLFLAAANLCLAIEPGQEAPDFRLTTIDGSETTLSQTRGNGSLLLDFGSVFCTNCQQTLSALKGISVNYGGKGLRVAAINIDTRNSARAVKAIAMEMGIVYPVLLDPEGIAATAYGVDKIPHMVLIDKNGKISVIHTGSSIGLERLISTIFGPAGEEK